MVAPWNKLATSGRWHGVVSFIQNWVGPFGPDQGMPPEKLDAILRAKSLDLPAAVCEWYLLAANWHQGGVNVWIPPRDLVADDGIVDVLHDKHGVSEWGVRVEDLKYEDPPIVTNNEIASPTFSNFVAAMIVNDLLFFDDESGEPLELKPGTLPLEGMHNVASCGGDFMADGPLESATIVMYAYSHNGPLFGKSRTHEGRTVLSRLRKH